VNLGPRNILAFLVFFVVVRHVEGHLKDVAARYFALKAHAAVDARPPLRAIDMFLSLYSPKTNGTEIREDVHDPREAHPAR